jgi:hypothetical protein
VEEKDVEILKKVMVMCYYPKRICLKGVWRAQQNKVI